MFIDVKIMIDLLITFIINTFIIFLHTYLIVKEISFRVFTLLDLDDNAPEPARLLSDDDMVILKTLRFYRDLMSKRSLKQNAKRGKSISTCLGQI